MTPFEIAVAIRNRANSDEDVQTFAQRTWAAKRCATSSPRSNC
jgi:hypothetical protein